MTKNYIISNSHIINKLNQNFNTKESQKISLNSTKVNIKYTKDFRFLILAINAFTINFCVL